MFLPQHERVSMSDLVCGGQSEASRRSEMMPTAEPGCKIPFAVGMTSWF